MGTTPAGTYINGNIFLDIQTADLVPNSLTETVQGFLLSGSLTTDSGIGDNVGVLGSSMSSGPYGVTSPDGIFTNIPVANGTNGGGGNIGNGTGMKVNITVASSTVGLIAIVDGGSGYAIGNQLFISYATLASFGIVLTSPNDMNLQTLTAADLTGGGTPYMVNFNPSPVETDPNVDTVTVNQKLLIGGPQLALYHAYNTTVSSSLYNTNLPQISNNNKGAGTLLWTTAGSDPANSNNYMTWAPDGSDAESYQDTNIPFLLERGDIIRVEGIKNLADTATNSSRSVNIIEDFIVEGIIPYYYSSSFDINQQNRNSLSGEFLYNINGTAKNQYLIVFQNVTNTAADMDPNNANTLWTGFVGGIDAAAGNPGRVGVLNNSSGGSTGYVASTIYDQIATSGGGTGAKIKVITTNSGVANQVQIDPDNMGTGYTDTDTIEFGDGVGATGAITQISSICDTKITVKRNGVEISGTGGKIEIDGQTGVAPGWNSGITISEGSGFLAGDVIEINHQMFSNAQGSIAAPQWAVQANVCTSANNGTMFITLANQVLGNTSFNNDFTVGVDVNSPIEGTVGAATPSGSQVGYHLYEEGEVGFTADTFIQVSPDPNISLKGLLLGEVKKFTVRRQIEADDKVMLENITPPSGSRGVDTPSGQGFLIPNDFSSTQKANALNIINQLKAKNAFDKPIEPGITKD